MNEYIFQIRKHSSRMCTTCFCYSGCGRGVNMGPEIPSPKKGHGTRKGPGTRDILSPRGQNDTLCENITFSQLRWGAVMNVL